LTMALICHRLTPGIIYMVFEVYQDLLSRETR
jgi:hypothetical protein